MTESDTHVCNDDTYFYIITVNLLKVNMFTNAERTSISINLKHFNKENIYLSYDSKFIQIINIS